MGPLVKPQNDDVIAAFTLTKTTTDHISITINHTCQPIKSNKSGGNRNLRRNLKCKCSVSGRNLQGTSDAGFASFCKNFHHRLWASSVEPRKLIVICQTVEQTSPEQRRVTCTNEKNVWNKQYFSQRKKTCHAADAKIQRVKSKVAETKLQSVMCYLIPKRHVLSQPHSIDGWLKLQMERRREAI